MAIDVHAFIYEVRDSLTFVFVTGWIEFESFNIEDYEYWDHFF